MSVLDDEGVTKPRIRNAKKPASDRGQDLFAMELDGEYVGTNMGLLPEKLPASGQHYT